MENVDVWRSGGDAEVVCSIAFSTIFRSASFWSKNFCQLYDASPISKRGVRTDLCNLGSHVRWCHNCI